MLLARHFLELRASRYGRSGQVYAADAGVALGEYEWPGNVRELRNVVERVVLIADTPSVSAAHLGISSRPRANIASATTSEGTARHGAAEEEPRFNLEALELRTIRAALATCDWNISGAARLLGLSRDRLRYRIKRLNICAPSAPATTSTETG